MKILIRLYRRHDIDLVTLYKTPSFPMHRVLYNALRAYVEGYSYHVPAPEYTKDISKLDLKSKYQMFLFLDETKDADLIRWLKTVKPLMRNVLLKTILRGAIDGSTIYGCFPTDAMREYENAINKQRNGTFYEKKKRSKKKEQAQEVTVASKESHVVMQEILHDMSMAPVQETPKEDAARKPPKKEAPSNVPQEKITIAENAKEAFDEEEPFGALGLEEDTQENDDMDVFGMLENIKQQAAKK